MPAISFWDMDHTIIDNDCDVSWKTFVIAEGLAPPEAQLLADEYFDLYVQARLPIEEFLEFQFAEFKDRSLAEVRALAQKHFDTIVRPRIFPAAAERVRQELAAGTCVCLLTATNRYVAEPLARHLNIPHVLATEAEMVDGRFTGKPAGVYCGGPGKVEHARPFCESRGSSLHDATYYGDSTNDIPLLEAVGRPVAVNPSDPLRRAAAENHWEILEWSLPARAN